MYFLNWSFIQFFLSSTFRTSYAHLQEDYIVHSALYGTFSMRLCKQSSGLKDVFDMYHIRLNVQYC